MNRNHCNLIPVIPEELIEIRKFVYTRRTPGCPEIDKCDPPALIRETELRSVVTCQTEIFQLHADIISV